MIPIFEPYLHGNEHKYLLECLDTNWISSQGRFIDLFEKTLAEFHGLEHCIATSSCTTALHLALKAFDIGPGDEVICPDLTFIAPANMIALCGAKPVLVDIDRDTLTIDPNLIEAKITEQTKAIIVVHQFGHAAHMDEIMAIARTHNLKVIEDNAESIGAKYKHTLIGTIGDIATYSFFANKIITSGEGGAIVTRNMDIAKRCRELRDHGMSLDKRYYHIELGYNYRMTNMQAAIGLAQLEQLETIQKIRFDQMKIYNTALAHIPQIRVRKFAEWTHPVHWMTTITLDRQYDRDYFLSFMRENGVDCRQMINPVHRARHFLQHYDESEFTNATEISLQSAHLPSSTSLTSNQIEKITEQISKFFISPCKQ